jgi:ribonuclease HIII
MPMPGLEETVASITKTATENDLVIASSRSIAYGVQLLITDAKESISLNIYNGKKGVSLTLGGSAASQLRQKVESLLAVPLRQSAKPAKTQDEGLDFANVEGFDGRWIGTDESGKGDFFGPLVVGAVLVDDETKVQLVAKGIKDCKVLSDDKVRALAVSIREICHGRYVELELLPTRYNSLYQQLRTEGKNLNQLLAWAHARAIEDLLQKEPCRFAIADKFADERLILSRLMEKGKTLVLLQSHRAERNIAVAAASILARDRFLAKLDNFRTQYGMEFPKGASAAVITAGRKFVAEHGREALANVAKVHFKTIDEI